MKLSKPMMRVFANIARGVNTREAIAKAQKKSLNWITEILQGLEKEGFIAKKRDYSTKGSRISIELASTNHAIKLKELIFHYPTIHFEDILSESKLLFLAALSEDWISIEEASKLSAVSRRMILMYKKNLQNRGVILKKKSLYTINDKAWPILKEFLVAYKNYVVINGTLKWKYQDEILMEVDSKELVKGIITGFAQYEKYGIKIFVVKVLCRIPEKKLSKEETFVYSLFQIEDSRTLHLALLFYLKNKLSYKKTLSLSMRYGKYSIFTNMTELLKTKQERIKLENLPEFDKKEFNRLAHMYGVKNV